EPTYYSVMKVLILYQFDNHDQTVDALCNNLNMYGIEPDSFNILTWRSKGQNRIRKPLLVSLLAPLMIIPKVKGLLIKLFIKRIVLTLSEKCNIVDIHFFSPIYDELIYELKRRGKNVKITIWGSDFYRTDNIRREQQRIIYHEVDIIQMATRQICNDFLVVYPEYENKVRITNFGILQFDIIDELLQKGDSEAYKKEMGLPVDKIILVCGFNGSAGHQHLLIFESIEKLPPELKGQLFLLVPMTYGGNKPYIETIKQKADSLGLPYKLLPSLVPVHDVCKLRIVSDIAITIQKTDALSAAVMEHIYAGSILIAGDWLPYQILSENGVFYLTTPLESLTETVSRTVENHSLLKNKCMDNNVKMAEIFSWNSVIKDWLAIYNELDN
ncbi:MAG TPA: hypothetical protein VIK14_16985, partial [Ignavibacteria bacterium]